MARQGQAYIRRARSSSAGSKQRRPHHGLPSYSPTTTCEQLRPSALTGRSNPPSLRASPADELHHFTDLPQLCTARNPRACQMQVRAGHSRGRCTSCNGGEGGRGKGVQRGRSARTWTCCTRTQDCPNLLKTDVGLLYLHAHRTKARATHQAPPRDTKTGAACPSARANTRRRQHPIQLRSRAQGPAVESDGRIGVQTVFGQPLDPIGTNGSAGVMFY